MGERQQQVGRKESEGGKDIELGVREDVMDVDKQKTMSKIEQKFFKAMTLFQKRNFRKAKIMFQKLIFQTHQQSVHKKDVETSKIQIGSNSVHMVNLINMIELKLRKYNESDLKKAMKNTSVVFVNYPFPDVFLKLQGDNKINDFSNTSVLDLVLDCIIEFNNPPPEVAKFVSFCLNNSLWYLMKQFRTNH